MALVVAACGVVETDLSKAGSDWVTPTVPTELYGDLDLVLIESLDSCDEGTLPLIFDEPGELHAFVLTLDAGQVLELSCDGDAGMDTVLYLHGPLDDLGDFGELPRAMNDDGSEDTLHASLDDFVVPQTGYWLVGVTTWAGASLGEITLEISVDGEDPTCDWPEDDDTWDWSDEDDDRGELVCCTDGEHAFAAEASECDEEDETWRVSDDLESCDFDEVDSHGRDE